MLIMDNKESQELDLLDVLKSIGNAIAKGFMFLLEVIGLVFRLIFQYKYVCIACMVLFGILGYYLNKEKIYRAETDLKLNSYSSYFVKDILDPLHLQSISCDSVSLSSALNLPIHDTKTITNIESFYYIDIQNNGTPDYIDYKGDFNANDTTMSVLTWRLRVRVEGKDTSVIHKMANAVSFLLTNNEQVKRENELRTNQLDERIAFVDREINLLDSLRRKEYFKKERDISVSMDKAILLNERDMKLFHSDLLDLNKVKQELEWERNFYSQGFVFENEFNFDPRPINGKMKTLPKYILWGLFFSIILCGGWKFKQRMSDYLNKQV